MSDAYDPMAALRQDREQEANREREALRDGFARAALPAFVAAFLDAEGGPDELAWDDYDDLADSAYNVADAMLRARGRGQ